MTSARHEVSRPPLASSVASELRAYTQLTKVRLTSLVVATTVVGFLMAGGPRLDAETLAWTVLGTALAAAGSMTLNQVLEAD
ncbi:MAG: hypothetical protein MUO25_14015, partial [Thermoanaerobaculaceae bacterium]|nr:hypothetical protein [Thermoanaerobaculaceae bacterium]